MAEPFNIPNYEYIGTYGPIDACDAIRNHVIIGDHTTFDEVSAMLGAPLGVGGFFAGLAGATVTGLAFGVIGIGIAVLPSACEFVEMVGDLQEEVTCEVALQVYIGGDPTSRRVPDTSAISPAPPVSTGAPPYQDAVIVVPVCKNGDVITTDSIINIAEPYVDELVDELGEAADTVDDLANTMEERMIKSVTDPLNSPHYDNPWTL